MTNLITHSVFTFASYVFYLLIILLKRLSITNCYYTYTFEWKSKT